MLMLGTTLLLLLACLNVASLLLAHGAERTQELTRRMALGASQGRIARQLIVESLVIALAGAGLFVQTLTRLYARDRGFESSSLMMFRADPARNRLSGVGRAAGHARNSSDAAGLLPRLCPS